MQPSPPSRRLIEHALLLIGRIHKGDPAQASAAEASLHQWRASDPHHAEAAFVAQQLWDGSDGSALRGEIALPRRHDPLARRRAMQLLGVAGMAALTAGGTRWWWHQATFEMALASERGELRDQMLPDGTELNLAARTRLAVTFFRDRREVRLSGGEARFSVQPDASRPFTVLTDWGRVQVLGTVFTVRAHARGMQVAVAQGRVGVWPAGQDADTVPPLTLGAGEGVRSDGGVLGLRQPVPAEAVGAWRRGWLVFDDTPLPEVLDRWNDYLPQLLRLGPQAKLRTLRLSGSFPVRQPQAFLRGLPDMLPVRVVRDDGGAVTVEAR